MTITGAIHVHSSFSYDAKLPVREIRAIAEARGLSFLCFTEHTDELTPENAEAFVAACREASDERFVCIPGFEVNYGGAHILMLGCRTFLGQFAKPEDLPLWKAGAALAVHAHPHRDGYREDETLASVADGIEIWNAQYDGIRAPRNGARRMLARTGGAKKAFAGWDFHRASHDGGPLLAVHVDAITEESILASLKTGNYTISSAAASLGSDGKLLRGSALGAALVSAASTSFIAFAKAINAALAALGLRVPKSAAAFVRSRI